MIFHMAMFSESEYDNSLYMFYKKLSNGLKHFQDFSNVGIQHPTVLSEVVLVVRGRLGLVLVQHFAFAQLRKQDRKLHE